MSEVEKPKYLGDSASNDELRTPVTRPPEPADGIYRAADVAADIGEPGVPSYRRGVHREMYRKRRWTIRQYSGFASAAESNARFRYLLDRGTTGLSVAFDLPTQLGLDSDAALAQGEVGRVGTAIDTIEDMERLLDGIPLDTITLSMTINAPAAILLAMLVVTARRRDIPIELLGGTVQNDILKEYAARGTYIYPPKASMRLTVDVLRYCAEYLPKFNPISISGYHFREAGSTAVEELAFTLADAKAYVTAAIDAGLDGTKITRRMSFFWNVHNNFFEEIAKFRAARVLWSTMLVESFGIHDEEAQKLRCHAQTAGSTLTAQEPKNNIVRVAVQSLAAVLGGTQSLHANGFDEALALPSEAAALIALRTQQILADETGVADIVDPLGGSYYVEALTDRLLAQARELIVEIDRQGGAVAAVESGWIARRIGNSAYLAQTRIEAGKDPIVGVTKYARETSNDSRVAVARIDARVERDQRARLATFRERRDGAAVAAALGACGDAAGDARAALLEPIIAAVDAGATIGEISEVFRQHFGVFHGA